MTILLLINTMHAKVVVITVLSIKGTKIQPHLHLINTDALPINSTGCSRVAVPTTQDDLAHDFRLLRCISNRIMAQEECDLLCLKAHNSVLVVSAQLKTMNTRFVAIMSSHSKWSVSDILMAVDLDSMIFSLAAVIVILAAKTQVILKFAATNKLAKILDTTISVKNIMSKVDANSAEVSLLLNTRKLDEFTVRSKVIRSSASKPWEAQEVIKSSVSMNSRKKMSTFLHNRDSLVHKWLSRKLRTVASASFKSCLRYLLAVLDM